jgi:cytochrome o ubiquinol oxidase subunit 2
MKRHHKIWLGVTLLLAAITALTGWYLHRHLVPVLQPAGQISDKERNLMVLTVSLAGLVVVPVFGLLGYFAWHYRESNHKAHYTPDVDGNRLAETIWWLIPALLIGVISVITWRSSYALDPFKPLDSNKKTLHVQVVALDWKWLFIYPDQHIASLNEAAIPVDTPVDFEITSDAVMSSFWVPQLAGQMYAMPGMSTQLHATASKPGDYRGVSANINGKGFADMKFNVHAASSADFNAWVAHASKSSKSLSGNEYVALTQPKQTNAVVYYKAPMPDLYDTIVMKYMMPMPPINSQNIKLPNTTMGTM